MRLLTYLGVGFVLFASIKAEAHPISFQGSTSVMSMNEHTMNDILVHYSFTPRFSLGGRFHRMENGTEESYSGWGQAAVLLYRLNHDLFQANLYAYGGFGGMRLNNQRSGLVSVGGAKADLENRRIFLGAEYEAQLMNKARDIHTYKGRAGVSAYLAEYTELNTWLMVEYDYRPGFLGRRHEIKPLARFFYKNVLWEAGSSLQGDWLLNFMVHF